MSTRHSIFFHEDTDTGVSIHIYRECISLPKNDIRIEIETPYGVTNVPWPYAAFDEQKLTSTSLES
jgi:hypothetical protein